MPKVFGSHSGAGAYRLLVGALLVSAWGASARGGIFIQPVVLPSPMIKAGHLENGVNGDAAPRKDGKTPLMLAVEAHNIDVIDYLLERGADPFLKDAAGETALDIARRIGMDDIAGKLDAYGKQHPDPDVYYAARTPVLYIAGGKNQVGAPDGGGPKSIAVYVMGPDGRPMVDAPVRFSVDGGGKNLITQASSPDSPSLLLRTDEYGICSANLHLPKTPNTAFRVTAAAGASGREAKVVFLAKSNDGKGSTASCFNPTDERAVLNPDGTVLITWKNHTDDEVCIRIWMDTPQGMKAVLSVPPHQTSAVLRTR